MHAALTLKGIIDLDTGGTTGKVIQVQAVDDVADLSIYGIGIAQNGGGTDGQEYTFPKRSATKGEMIWIAVHEETIKNYFGNCVDYGTFLEATSDINHNGTTIFLTCYNFLGVFMFNEEMMQLNYMKKGKYMKPMEIQMWI